MKTNLFRKLTTAILSLLMFCQASPGWAEVHGVLTKNGEVLTFEGGGIITRELAQNDKFKSASEIVISGSIEEIESLAFEGYSRLMDVTFEHDFNKEVSFLKYGDNPFKDVGGSRGIRVFLDRTLVHKDHIPGVPFEQENLKGMFEDNLNVSTVIFEEHLGMIAPRTFRGAKNLVVFDGSKARNCHEIPLEAFMGCSLDVACHFPPVVRIGDRAFQQTNVYEVYVGWGLKHIGERAFAGCHSLTSYNDSFIDYDMSDNYYYVDPVNLTSIGEGAFEDCPKLRIFKLSSKLEEIKPYTFYGCTNLLLVDGIPESVTSIGEFAFYNCSSMSRHDELRVPSKVIGPSAFEGCYNIRKLSLGDVEHIGAKAFEGCYLFESLTLPKTLTDIEEQAFSNCKKLKSISIPSNVRRVQSQAFVGCLALTKAYVHSATEIASDAFPEGTQIVKEDSYSDWLNSHPNKASKTELYIPDDIIANHSYDVLDNLASLFPNVTKVTFGEDVTTVGDYIFCLADKIQNIEFKSNVSVGKYAFYSNKQLQSITGSEYITRCGEYSFSECASLASLSLSKDCRYINRTSFFNCQNLKQLTINSQELLSANYEIASTLANQIGGNLETIIIGDDVESIGVYAFANSTTINSVTFGSSVKTISRAAFRGCTALTSISLQNGLKTIGSEVFAGCENLVTASMPNSVTGIGSGAFKNCLGLKAINLPNGLRNIEKETFYRCWSLKSVTIPSDVNSIGNGAFQGCELTSVTIPSSVTTILSNAFTNNSSLTDAYILGTTQFANDVFPSTTTIHYNSIADADLTYDQWLQDYPKPAEVTELFIPNNKVANPTTSYTQTNNLATKFPNVTKVVFGPSVTSLGQYIFDGASNLKSVEFNSNVIVGSYAFRNNVKLSSLPSEKLKECWAESFAGCAKLTELNLTVCEGIGPNAFNHCTALESVSITNALKTAEKPAFIGCTNLKTLYTDSPVLLAKNYSETTPLGTIFGGNLEKLVVGDHVTTIGGYAFNGATTLQDVTLGTGLNKIESTSFEGCSNLTKARINSNGIVNNSDFHEQYNLTNIFGWLKEMTFGTEVTSIGDDVFNAATQGDYYPLEKVTFVNGSNIAVGAGAFQNCQNLTTVEGNIKSVGISSFENTKINRISIIEDAIIEKRAFAGCSELTEAYLSYDLETIKEEAFYGCRKLSQLNLPSLVTVEKNAFKYCSSLVSIEFPENLATVDLNAFADCTSLIAVRFDGNTFANANWTKTDNIYDRFPKMKYLDFGPEVTAVHDYAYYVEETETSTLESIYIYTPAAIGKSAFENNKQLIKVEDAIKSVGYYAFRNCSGLKSISIAQGPIGQYAFQDCSSLESVTLPEDLEVINQDVFRGCSSLAEVEIPSGVTKIGDSAFRGCSSLAKVEIPESVTTIDGGAFWACSSLNQVICHVKDPITISTTVFNNSPYKTGTQLLVPVESLEAYKNANVWKNFFDIFAIGGVKLQDGQPYTNMEEKPCDMVKYIRTYKNTAWQALILPFSLDYDDWKDNFEIAKIYNIIVTESASTDLSKATIQVVLLGEGESTIPNVPYEIRAKHADSQNPQVITKTNCVLYPAEPETISCSNTETTFTFDGTYTGLSKEEMAGHFGLSGGGWSYQSGKNSLSPFRIYLTVESKDGGYNASTLAGASIRNVVVGEDEAGEANAIETVVMESMGDVILERQLIGLPRGKYQINGKTITVK